MIYYSNVQMLLKLTINKNYVYCISKNVSSQLAILITARLKQWAEWRRGIFGGPGAV